MSGSRRHRLGKNMNSVPDGGGILAQSRIKVVAVSRVRFECDDGAECVPLSVDEIRNRISIEGATVNQYLVLSEMNQLGWKILFGLRAAGQFVGIEK